MRDGFDGDARGCDEVHRARAVERNAETSGSAEELRLDESERRRARERGLDVEGDGHDDDGHGESDAEREPCVSLDGEIMVVERLKTDFERERPGACAGDDFRTRDDFPGLSHVFELLLDRVRVLDVKQKSCARHHALVRRIERDERSRDVASLTAA